MAQCEANDKVMRECMSAQTEVIRDWVMAQNEANSQMMRDCMSSMTSLVKENNSLLLKGLLDLGSKVESLCSHKTTQSSSNATSLHASITQADKRDSQPAVMFITPAVDPQSPQTSTQACTAHVPKDTTDTSFKQPEITSDASRSSTIAYIQSHTDALRSSNLSSPCILSCAESTKTHNVKLPPFFGKPNEWKVWFSRFTAVANVNDWNDTTRLCELLQRLQGVAAESVFDEISPDCRSNYSNLVRELDLRFKCVETNKSYRALFSKRTQHFGESVENYASELKRLYDKAYPGKNPEMQRTLLLQQFMSGLGDRQAKCAVEYFKEPSSIEDAVHNVVMYIETHQTQHAGSRSLNRSSNKTVSFAFDDDNENDEDDDTATHSFYDNGHCERIPAPTPSPSATQVTRREHVQSIRKVQSSDTRPNSQTSDQISSELQGIRTALSKISQAFEVSSSSNSTMKPDTHAWSNRPPVAPTSTRNQVQGQGMSQGRDKTRSPDRLSNVQCHGCREWGHMKRDCPILRSNQYVDRNSASMSLMSQGTDSPFSPFYDQSTMSNNSIALN